MKQERPSGLWIGAEELARLPTSGPAWDRVKAAADGELGPANIADQDSNHDINTLAVALVYARTGIESYREKAVRHLLTVVATDDKRNDSCDYSPNIARSLAVARNLAAYVIAADLVGLRADGDPNSGGSHFARWVDELRFKENCPNTGEGGRRSHGAWRNLSESHDSSGSNGSALAGGARVAAALYLGDTAEVQRAWETFQRYAGDRSVGPDLGFNEDGLTWSHDRSTPVAINPAGTTKDGHRIDGAIINDQGRGGRFRWPPRYTSYPWDGLQGAYLQAHLLSRAGYPTWEASDRALLRAIEYQKYLEDQTGKDKWWGRTDWVVYLANYVYGTQLPVEDPAGGGRNMAWTGWTHPSYQAATP